MEIFKNIIGYEGLYQVSNFGRIKSLPKGDGNGYRERILIQEVIRRNHTNYKRVTLSKNGKTKRFQVHRLVGIHFINNDKNKPQINHLDNNGENNHYLNLEWATANENMQHSERQGRLLESQKKGGRGIKLKKDTKTLEDMRLLLGGRFEDIKYINERKYIYYVCKICSESTKCRQDSILIKKDGICNSCARRNK